MDFHNEQIPSMSSGSTPGVPLFGGGVPQDQRTLEDGPPSPRPTVSCSLPPPPVSLSLKKELVSEEGGVVSVDAIKKAFSATEEEFLHLVKRCVGMSPHLGSVGFPTVSFMLPTSETPEPEQSLAARHIGAEFIGTFILMFAGTATAIVNQKTQGSETLIGCAGSSGLAVMIVILSTGHISGAHLNPAITISFAALKHFPWKHVPSYISAQVLASLCSSFALKEVFHPFMSGGVTVPSGGYGQAFILEFIISFNLMFVVTGVATDTRAVGELAGIAVGATVMVNILIAGPMTGASMNPVRTLGPAIAANNYKGIWVYLVAPILGALVGAGAYTTVKLPEEHDNAVKAKPSIPRSFKR